MSNITVSQSLLDKNKYPVPVEILINPHKVLYHDENYLILDGIDINGKKIADELVSIYYTNGEDYATFMLHISVWMDRQFFWAYVKGVINGMKKGI